MNDKYESIILAVNRAELPAALELYDKLNSIGKKALILTKDNTIASDKKFPVRSFQSYRNHFHFTYSNLMREAHGLLSSLAKEEVDKNLTLRELTKYKEVSLWDLSVQDIVSEFLPILYDLNTAETVLNFEKPREVHIINGVNNLEKIFGLVCKKKEIPFFIHKTANMRTFNLNKLFWKFIIFAKKIKRLLANLRFLFSNLIKSRNLNKKYKIVFFGSVERYLASILPVIFKYNNEERLVINIFSSSTKKLKELEIPYMDFYGYKPYGLINKDARNLLGKIQDAINKNNSFYDKLLFKEVAIGSILRNLFEKLIYEVFPHNMQKVDIARKILLSYRPEIVVVINSSVDIVLTAKTLSIPVLAIQSGFIEEFCCFGPIVANTITVNGSYWKEYLLKRQDVVPGKILVTGPTKFDAILNKRFNINSSNKKIAYGNNSNTLKGTRKKVIFASVYVDLPVEMFEYERIEQFRSVCKAIKDIREAHLIIKLHPCEKDLKIYKEIVQETNLTNYNIIRNVEMLEALSNCDLLITHTSTASYEAVVLDKNVISLFGSSKFESEDAWNFRKYGATIIIDNLKDLEKYIRSALFNPETQAKLKKGRVEYLYEHAYKLDGNASGRVKEVIDRFISK